jgi:predicted proteasome-type protease
LDRGIRFEKTTLEEAAKYALLSLDSTMKSNVTVGPPIDLLAYETDQLAITHQRRFMADDADLMKIGQRWQQALRVAVARLPNIRFALSKATEKVQESIQLVETTPSAEPSQELQSQAENAGRGQSRAAASGED